MLQHFVFTSASIGQKGLNLFSVPASGSGKAPRHSFRSAADGTFTLFSNAVPRMDLLTMSDGHGIDLPLHMTSTFVDKISDPEVSCAILVHRPLSLNPPSPEHARPQR